MSLVCVQMVRVLNELYDKKEARAVVIIAAESIASMVIEKTGAEYPGHFIWICTDALAENIGALQPIAEAVMGSFLVVPFSEEVPKDYIAYFEGLRPVGKKNNISFVLAVT